MINQAFENSLRRQAFVSVDRDGRVTDRESFAYVGFLARGAGVKADVVLGWAEDPLFIAAIGWLVVGLADNHEC
jgi:hypothetical protein